jgi:glycosyltransferase involved in cell wall biosynthesis
MPLDGSSRIAHELASHLNDLGTEVTTITDCPQQNISLLRRNYKTVSVGARFSPLNASNFKRTVRSINPDVVHYHGGEALCYYAGLANLGSDYRQIVTLTFVPPIYRKSYPIWKKIPFTIGSTLGNLERCLIKFDSVISLSVFAKEQVERDCPSISGKAQIIRYGVSEEFLSHAGNNNEDSGGIVFPLGPGRGRGFETISAAVNFVRSQFPLASFFLAPRNPTEANFFLQHPPPLGMRVMSPASFLESVATHSIVALPFDEHVSVDPPLSLLESMALGKTVVSTCVASIPEVLADSRGVTVSPRDPQKLAQALCLLLREPAFCNEIGTNARDYISTTYNWNSAIESILDVYRQ